jgi:N utilization substance protein B
VNVSAPHSERQKRMNARTRGRELAAQLAYAWEANRYVDDGMLMTSDEAVEDAEVLAFAKQLFTGMCAERTAIDAEVDKRLENWTIQRLAAVDRGILRLGTYELIYCRDTPPKVAINEFIELAKSYGSDARTAKLVNGVLDRVARDHRADEVAKRPAK